LLQTTEVFAALHKRGEPLLLANAWDAASAVVIEGAGAKAIATTSGGVAWSLGVPDGADLGMERAATAIGRIAAAVSVPVSADIEAGYGDAPDAVAAMVAAVVEAGAVGVNLEDRPSEWSGSASAPRSLKPPTPSPPARRRSCSPAVRTPRPPTATATRQ
jgi:2-methylisocitrate lyase-like PEP mutase family enzyme